MQLFKNTNYNFISFRRIAYIISSSIILFGLIFYFINGGFNWGIDFQGGIKLQVKFDKALELKDIETIRNSLQAEVKSLGNDGKVFVIQRKLPNFIENKEILLKKARKENKIFKSYDEILTYLNLDKNIEEDFKKYFSLENMDKKVNINTAPLVLIKSKISNLMTNDIVKSFQDTLSNIFKDKNKYIIEGTSLVGPSIGKKYQSTAIYALFFALIGILIYISLRFEFIYSIGAIAALIHDILITLTVFAIFHLEINLPVIVALLTLIGYSLNDTIVVDDRIREIRKFQKGTLGDLINIAINKTLSRTFLTSLTTFVVVLSLFIFSGTVLKEFSIAFLVGIVTGTYSSIYIAAPIVLEFTKK
ncbi:protein translocase subunit SecF [bacterium]|nr:protein translocase subunit SecF [bacterium]